MKLTLRVFSLLAVLVLGLVSARAQTIEIQQHWAVGKKYFVTMQMAQQSTFAMAGKTIEQGMTMTMETSMAVSQHEDGLRKRILLRYDRTAMEMNMSGQKISYDSAKPGEGTDPLGMGKTIGAMVGKELKLVANAKDEITDIENFDELLASFAPSAVPGFDIRKMFDKEQLTQSMRQGALQSVPGKPVAPGDSWPFSNAVTMPQLGKVAISGNYTFQKMGERNGVPCAEITVDGKVSMDMAPTAEADPANPNPVAALQMKVTNGSIKGTLWFDPKLGVARDVQLVQEMTISMKNPLDPTATIDVPMKQTIGNTLTKIEDVK